MAKTFKLELLAADRPFFVGECEHLIYPAQDGLVGVLPGHESLVTIVSPGEIQYKVDGEWRYAAISEGFAEIRSDYALILGDAIELPEEIDAKRAAIISLTTARNLPASVRYTTSSRSFLCIGRFVGISTTSIP